MPSYSSLVGAFGLGKQSGQGTPQTTMTYLPVLQNGLNLNQTVNALQPEVGGDYFLRSSYKASVSGGGNVNFYPRGDSIGLFFNALSGQDTVTPVSGQSGAYSHVFTPFSPTSGLDLPWYTAQAVKSQIWTEQHQDSKLNTLTIDINKQTIVTATANFFSLVPSEIATPSAGSQVFDNSPVFNTCLASITLVDEITTNPISSTLTTSVDRLNLQYSNQLSQDEFVVGSFYATGTTLLQRTCQISADVIIRDKKLWEAVYLNGGTSSWSPTVKRVALTVTLTSDRNIGSTTQPWTTTFTFPGIDLMMLPVQPSGAQLLRATLSAQLTLGPSGSDRFTITSINSIASF